MSLPRLGQIGDEAGVEGRAREHFHTWEAESCTRGTRATQYHLSWGKGDKYYVWVEVWRQTTQIFKNEESEGHVVYFDSHLGIGLELQEAQRSGHGGSWPFAVIEWFVLATVFRLTEKFALIRRFVIHWFQRRFSLVNYALTEQPIVTMWLLCYLLTIGEKCAKSKQFFVYFTSIMFFSNCAAC